MGVSRPHGHGAGFRPPPVSVANIMVKNNTYRPTSELVSMMYILKYYKPANINPYVSRTPANKPRSTPAYWSCTVGGNMRKV